MGIKVRAPGRICLFGEHQDYLGFPVIAAAINKYIFIESLKRDSEIPKAESCKFLIHLPDLGKDRKFLIRFPRNTSFTLEYDNKREYFKSVLNVLSRNGFRWNTDREILLRGTIPINAGASSSSAMVIAWILYLIYSTQEDFNELPKGFQVDPEQIAIWGYEAEVQEFGEAGGMMDHFASALGSILFVASTPSFHTEHFTCSLDGLVLADSGVKKNTVDDLKRVKKLALDAFTHLKEIDKNFDRFRTPLKDALQSALSLNKEEQKIIEGQLKNRDITRLALQIFKQASTSHLGQKQKEELGRLIYEHHQQLSRNVGVSIPTIDKMVEIAMENKALGAKINGSGFGGTMFAYAPGNADRVYQALKDEGFEAWKIEVSKGAQKIS